MNNDIKENVEEILQDDLKISEFASLNRLSVEASKKVLEKLLEEPEIAQEFKDYIFSSERSEDFKGYTAGEEKGYQRGHEAGFAKGTVIGILGSLTVAGLAILTRGK